MKDASTYAAIVTKDGSKSTSAVILTQAEKKDASTFVQVKKKNVSTSVVNVDSETQVETEEEGEDECRCKPIQSEKTIRELPFDEPCDIILFDTDLENTQNSSDVVGFVTAPRKIYIDHLAANSEIFGRSYHN